MCRLDENCGKNPPHTMYQTVFESLGVSMLVLCLLDFCRLKLSIPLTIPGELFTLFKKVLQ
jgi:hypothetical protein